MKTVWDLISPVSLLVNSAVTKSGGRVREVAVLALVDAVLGGLEAVVAERQRHRPGEVLDRRDLLEDLFQTGLGGDVLTGLQSRLDASLPGVVAEEPVEALGLQRQKVRNLEGLLDLCKGDAQRGGAGSVVRIRGRGIARGGQEGVLPRARTHYARTGPSSVHGDRGCLMWLKSQVRHALVVSARARVDPW
ncbi:hypothetical protein RKD37_004061 [Streptomyces ambofaciens]